MTTLAILCGHHGIGTGAAWGDRDEWTLARGDGLELYLQLRREGIVNPVLEPMAADDNPAEGKRDSLLRAARWALSQKPAAVMEIHYNSFETTDASGHEVCSNRMTPFVETMADALDVLPNKRRSTIIHADYTIAGLVDPIPYVLIEPAFIFEKWLADAGARGMVVAAVKNGLYTYFAGGE